MDELNDETFGSGAIGKNITNPCILYYCVGFLENDWEASHLSTLKALHSEGKEIPAPSYHHDTLFAEFASPAAAPNGQSSSSSRAINENVSLLLVVVELSLSTDKCIVRGVDDTT